MDCAARSAGVTHAPAPDPMPGPESAPVPAARRPVPVLRWVVAGVGTTFLLLFLLSFLALATGVADLGNSRFVERAREDFLGFILWTNVLILLKGYGLLALAYTVVLYPLVSLWLRGRSGRWAVLWRTWLLVLASIVLKVLHLFWRQPYFSGDSWYNRWFLAVLEAVPGPVLHWGFLLVFRVGPVALALIVGVYYLRALGRRWRGWSPRGRRTAGASLALLVVAGVAVLWWPEARAGTGAGNEGPRRMNVLIIASDSLRGDRISANGHFREVSPHIDALAAKSTNFTKCLTPIGSTLESMAGMLTAQYPHRHGFRQMFPGREQVERFNRESATLASLLAAEGYETAVIGDWCAAIFNLTPMGFGEVQVSDFDNFRIWVSQAVFMHHFVVPLFFDNELGYALFPELQSFAFFLKPEVVTDRVVRKLGRRDAGNDPFFWTVFYSCNHLNYHSPDPYYKRWTDPDYDGPHKFMVALNPDEFARNTDIGRDYAGMRREDVEQIRALYDGCTTQFDDCVGRILAKLEETGELENTIVIITSDHGDDLFEPGVSFCHGITFSGGDQGNHIPFVLHVPGREPRTVDRIVRNIDIAPTVLDLLGLPSEEDFDGVSLVPYVDDPEADLGLAFYGETSYLFFKRQIPGEVPLEVPPMHETTYIDEAFDHHIVLQQRYHEAVVKTKERCLRTEEFKLVYTPGQFHPIHRLYHLPSDPHCERDVKADHPEVYTAMKKHLWAWIAEGMEARIPAIEADHGVEEVAVPREFLEIDWGVEP